MEPSLLQSKLSQSVLRREAPLREESDKLQNLPLIPGLASVTPSRRTSCGGRSQAASQKRNCSRKSRLYSRLPAEKITNKKKKVTAAKSYLQGTPTYISDLWASQSSLV